MQSPIANAAARIKSGFRDGPFGEAATEAEDEGATARRQQCERSGRQRERMWGVVFGPACREDDAIGGEFGPAEGADLGTALAEENESIAVMTHSEDFKEGIRAFQEKRAPRFVGR